MRQSESLCYLCKKGNELELEYDFGKERFNYDKFVLMNDIDNLITKVYTDCLANKDPLLKILEIDL